MLRKEEINRYSRHLSLSEFGIEGQEKLKKSKILVIGAGGLGCPALLYLTAAGIGEIGILDFDAVDISNLQRQILYYPEDLGNSKAATAAEKLSKQNPFLKFNIHDLKLDNTNALEIFKDYDVIIDGSDNFATKYLVNDACLLLDKPLVYGSVLKFEGQISVFNFKKGPTYRCIFPEPPLPENSPNCSEIGVIGVLPGIIGTLQATEAIKIITGIGETLSGKLLLFDALTMNFNSINTERTNEGLNASPKNAEEFKKYNYEYFCGSSSKNPMIKNISASELQSMLDRKEDIELVDVRELNEKPIIEELTGLQIPLNEIPSKSHLISKEKKVVVFCRSGARSKRAIELLHKDLPETFLYNLEGGINEWIHTSEMK